MRTFPLCSRFVEMNSIIAICPNVICPDIENLLPFPYSDPYIHRGTGSPYSYISSLGDSLRPSAEDRWSVTPGRRIKYPSTYLLYWVKASVSMYCILCICKWTSLPRLTLQPWWLVGTLSWGPLECYTGAPHKISIHLFIILSTS